MASKQLVKDCRQAGEKNRLDFKLSPVCESMQSKISQRQKSPESAHRGVCLDAAEAAPHERSAQAAQQAPQLLPGLLVGPRLVLGGEAAGEEATEAAGRPGVSGLFLLEHPPV